jgi:hypothetical protein
MPWRLAVGKKQMVLQGMEDALTKQRKFRSAVPHTFDEFQFIHFSFDQTIILRESEPCNNGWLIPFNTHGKALQFMNLADFCFLKPSVELVSPTCVQHLGKLLNEVVGEIDFWMKLSKRYERFLVIRL